MPSPRPSAPRSLDWGRVRAAMRGMPKNYISMGTVGHTDLTPAYARVEDGDVLVEITLVPSGDEIVARLTMTAVDGGGIYMPLSYGQRVVIAFPGGSGSDPVIVGRCGDSSWPFPDDVAGVSTGSGTAPMFAFYKTQDGQLFAIETGDGADVLIHTGASIQLKASGGEQIMLTGRTHIGLDFSSAPIGSTVGKSGEVTPGTPAGAPNITTNTNKTVPPPLKLPADGIFRIKDTVQSNIVIDPDYWAYTAALTAFFAAWLTETNADPTLLAAYPVSITAAGTVASTALLATTLTSQPASGSKHTASDG